MAQTDTLTYLIRFKVDATDTTKLNQITQALKGLGVAPKVAQAGVTSLGDSLWKLTSRAALTIPVWLALRSAMMGVFTTFSDGITSLIDVDTALHDVQNELLGMKNLDTFMLGLRENASKLSQETGTAIPKVIETFRQFATAGIDAETSLAGMNTAVKGAVATMGDSLEVGRFLADVYNQMGNKITEVTGTQEKFNYIMSTITALMPTNTFTIKQFMDAYANFGGTAKAANLTLDETFALIASSATAMQRGARGGTQLASAFAELSKKSEEIRLFLGKESLEGMSQFEIFSSVLEKAAKTINTPAGNNTILAQIEGLFGNRGGRDVKALAANIEQFRKQMELLKNATPEERQAALTERYGTAAQKMALGFSQIKINLNLAVGAFLEGLTGTNDFASALGKINKFLEDMIPLAKKAGEAIKAFGVIAAGAGIALGAGSIVGGIGNVAKLGAGAFTFGKIANAGSNIAGASFATGVIVKAIADGFKGVITKIPGIGLLANPIGLIGATAGAAGYASNVMTSATIDYYDKKNKADTQASEQAMIALDLQRMKKGLPLVRPDLLPPQINLDKITVVGNKKAEQEIETKLQTTLEQKLSLIKEMSKYGYNDLEIAYMSYDVAKKYTTELEAQAQLEIDLLKAKNKEAREFSENLKKTAETNLSDVFMNESTFADMGANIGKAIRRGFADAFAGNIMDQIFKTTNIGGIFGDVFANIRHANDKVGGPIKSAFDYGGKQTYDWIVKGFVDGQSGKGGIATLTSAGGLGNFGGMTLPGFGTGGIFNTPIGMQRGSKPGTIKTSQGIEIPLSAVSKPGATWGQGLGVLGGGLMSGYSTYQSAGGAQGGGMAMGAGIMGGLGSIGMGIGSLQAGAAAGSLFGAGGMLGSALIPGIGIALAVGAMIMSAMAKTKSTSVEERSSTKNVASRIDVTNNKLDLVNRNLIALRNTMETFVLPESAYFSEKRLLLEDQFSIDMRR